MRFSQTKVQQRLLGLDKQIMNQNIGNCLELKKKLSHEEKTGRLEYITKQTMPVGKVYAPYDSHYMISWKR